MPDPLRVHHARTYPLAVDAAFDILLPTPLPDLFDRWYGPLPPVRAVDGPGERWGTVGQQRTIHLAGGGTMHEELVRVSRPDVFAYELTRLTGPLRALAARIEGRWTCEPAGTGVRIGWLWDLHPASRAGVPLLPALGRLWNGYARNAFDRLEGLLLPA